MLCPSSRARAWSCNHGLWSALHGPTPAPSQRWQTAHLLEPPTSTHSWVARWALSPSLLVILRACARCSRARACSRRSARVLGCLGTSRRPLASGQSCVAAPNVLHAATASSHTASCHALTAGTGRGCNSAPFFAYSSAKSFASLRSRSAGCSWSGTCWCALTLAMLSMNFGPCLVACANL